MNSPANEYTQRREARLKVRAERERVHLRIGNVKLLVDGTYSIGAPRAGTPITSDPGHEPSSAAADYHTHPVVPGYDNQHFSPQDKAGNRQEHLPGYLGTPTRILKYDPVTNRVTVLRKDYN